MSLLHRDQPPEAGADNVLAVKGHWVGQHFRVKVQPDPYRLAQAG